MRDPASRHCHTQGYTAGIRESNKHPRWVTHHPQGKTLQKVHRAGWEGEGKREEEGKGEIQMCFFNTKHQWAREVQP